MLLLFSFLRLSTADDDDESANAIEQPEAANVGAIEDRRREVFYKLREGAINNEQFREAELSLRNQLINIIGRDPAHASEVQRRREELLKEKEENGKEDDPDMHGHGGEIQPRGNAVVMKGRLAVFCLIALIVLLAITGTVMFMTRRRRLINKWRKRSDRLPSVFDPFV
jgi:hypothetical protein